MSTDIYFKDEQHKKTLIDLLNKYKKIDSEGVVKDPWYLAVFYIFSSDDVFRDKCIPYISEEGISFLNLLGNENFSTAYRLLLKLAFTLYNPVISVNNNIVFNLNDLINTLDRKNFEVAIQGIRLAYDCPIVIKK